jgi:hypothetical protein
VLLRLWLRRLRGIEMRRLVIITGKLKGTKQDKPKELKLLDGKSDRIDYRKFK